MSTKIGEKVVRMSNILDELLSYSASYLR